MDGGVFLGTVTAMGSYRLWRAVDAATLGPARRRRRMSAQLHTLDQLDYLDYAPAPQSPTARAGVRAQLVAGATISALAVVLWLPNVEPTPPARAVQASSWPADSDPPATSRLRPAVTAPPGEGGFEVLHRNALGQPARYDPCTPIRYVINAAGGPLEGTDLIRESFGELSRYTGLRFEFTGHTDEVPRRGREAVQIARYGNRFAPVVVAWATASTDADLAGNAAGYAGSTVVRTADGSDVYVTGVVVLDAEQLHWDPGERVQRAGVKSLVLHELGHLVGLGHVNDTDQLMYRSGSLIGRGFGDGDLRGLALLGSGDCIARD